MLGIRANEHILYIFWKQLSVTTTYYGHHLRLMLSRIFFLVIFKQAHVHFHCSPSDHVRAHVFAMPRLLELDIVGLRDPHSLLTVQIKKLDKWSYGYVFVFLLFSFSSTRHLSHVV